MKKLSQSIFIFLLILSIIATIWSNKLEKAQLRLEAEKTAQIASQQATEHVVYTKEKIKERIKHYANYYHVSEATMIHIVEKESSYNVKAIRHNDGRTGCTARGLAQLNSCYMGKGIPEKDAYNPEFALDILARKLKNGQCKQWSTCPYKV